MYWWYMVIDITGTVGLLSSGDVRVWFTLQITYEPESATQVHPLDPYSIQWHHEKASALLCTPDLTPAIRIYTVHSVGVFGFSRWVHCHCFFCCCHRPVNNTLLPPAAVVFVPLVAYSAVSRLGVMIWTPNFGG